jgi:hypothetical protein
MRWAHLPKRPRPAPRPDLAALEAGRAPGIVPGLADMDADRPANSIETMLNG